MGTLTESSHRGGSNNLKESRESLADGKKCEYTGRGSIQSNQRSNDTLNSLEMKLTLAQDRIEEVDKAAWQIFLLQLLQGEWNLLKSINIYICSAIYTRK
jgi:hypothetical protein